MTVHTKMITFPRKTTISLDIYYFLPDHPLIIQEFFIQIEDVLPHLESTKKFLKFWEDNIDGKISQIDISDTETFKLSVRSAKAILDL